MATSTILDPNTTVMAVDVGLESKTVVLTYNPPYTNPWNPYSPIPREGRIVYIKNAPLRETPFGSLNLLCSTGVAFIQNFVTIEEKYINTRDCFTLVEFSFITVFNQANDYFLPLSVFDSANATYAYTDNPTAGAQAVSVSGSSSFLFVDLRTQSKAILLPSIESLSETSSNSSYFVLKDSYGNANLNPLFISTTGGARIDANANTTIRIINNFACIELVANKEQNNWLVLNFFNGGI
jgi:hypothetical protein